MKKIILLTLTLTLLLQNNVFSQFIYRQAGVRTGIRSGIFFQATTEAGNAEVGYNAMLSFSNNGIQVTGLRIIYEEALIDISPDLYLAWGYGGHAGFIVTDHLGHFGEDYYFPYERLCPVLGADGWLAAEYRFYDIPLVIGLNIKPFVELTIPAFVRVRPGDIGISISYVF